MGKGMKAGAYAFYKEIKRYIEKYGMLSAEDGVVAGVSGGADSMCLLYILCALQKEYRLRLAVVHVNHGIRGAAADSDEEFVRRECEMLGVPFYAAHEDVLALAAQGGLTQEEAGRSARYRAFHKAAAELGYEKIAVAHNENDNAETFLFQVLRGSGVWGLAGIAPCRNEQGHTIIRPLLSVSRAQIEVFLAQEGHTFCTDMTNLSKDYARNRIRNELLPMAEAMLNTRAVSHLAQTAAQMHELKGFLEAQVQKAYRAAAKEVRKAGGQNPDEYGEGAKCEQVCLEISVWQQQPVFLQQEVALYAIGRAAGSRRDITRAHVEAVCSLMQRQTGRHIELPHGLGAVRQYNQVRIGPEEKIRSGQSEIESASFTPDQSEAGGRPDCQKLLQLNTEQMFEIETLPWIFSFGGCELSLHLMEGGLAEYETANEKNSLNKRNCYTKCFDYGRIGNILVLRTRRPGDYILIHGGQSKKRLNALFTDAKVPGEYREALPLLAAGSNVIWAVGVRSSEGFLVTENTKQILVVELKKRGKELQWQKKSV